MKRGALSWLEAGRPQTGHVPSIDIAPYCNSVPLVRLLMLNAFAVFLDGALHEVQIVGEN